MSSHQFCRKYSKSSRLEHFIFGSDSLNLHKEFDQVRHLFMFKLANAVTQIIKWLKKY